MVIWPLRKTYFDIMIFKKKERVHLKKSLMKSDFRLRNSNGEKISPLCDKILFFSPFLGEKKKDEKSLNFIFMKNNEEPFVIFIRINVKTCSNSKWNKQMEQLLFMFNWCVIFCVRSMKYGFGKMEFSIATFYFTFWKLEEEKIIGITLLWPKIVMLHYVY